MVGRSKKKKQKTSQKCLCAGNVFNNLKFIR